MRSALQMTVIISDDTGLDVIVIFCVAGLKRLISSLRVNGVPKSFKIFDL
jgi:hypothetical protein